MKRESYSLASRTGLALAGLALAGCSSDPSSHPAQGTPAQGSISIASSVSATTSGAPSSSSAGPSASASEDGAPVSGDSSLDLRVAAGAACITGTPKPTCWRDRSTTPLDARWETVVPDEQGYCALDGEGAFHCGATPDALVPVAVPDSGIALDGAGPVTCVVTKAGEVHCVGRAAESGTPRPKKLNVPDSAAPIRDIAVGTMTVVVVDEKRRAFGGSWLGASIGEPEYHKVDLYDDAPLLEDVTRVWLQGFYGCAMQSSGEAHCFDTALAGIRLPSLDGMTSVALTARQGGCAATQTKSYCWPGESALQKPFPFDQPLTDTSQRLHAVGSDGSVFCAAGQGIELSCQSARLQ